MRRVFLFVLCGFLMSIGRARAAGAMNTVAERYVRLVMALAQHDPDYVDAFYGPADWKTQAEKEKKSLDAIATEATRLFDHLQIMHLPRSGGQPSHSDAATTPTKKSGSDMDCCAPGMAD